MSDPDREPTPPAEYYYPYSPAPGTPQYPPPGAPPYPMTSPYPVSPLQPMPRRTRWVTGADLRAGLVVIGVLALLGLVAGALWAHFAPRLPFRVTSPGNVDAVHPEGEVFFAADGWFVLLTAIIGALAGLAAWLVRSARGPLMALALALGGVAGALVAWRFGQFLAPAPDPADLQQTGRIVLTPLRLRAWAALMVESAVALIVYIIAAGFTRRDDLGRPSG